MTVTPMIYLPNTGGIPAGVPYGVAESHVDVADVVGWKHEEC